MDDYGQTLYVNYSPASDILRLEGLLDNPRFDRTKNITIGVVSSHSDEVSASVAYQNELSIFYPEYNKMRVLFRGSAIECVETGERFRNQSECAEKHNIRQGNLSKHLRNLPGCKHIKGRTYRRVL